MKVRTALQQQRFKLKSSLSNDNNVATLEPTHCEELLRFKCNVITTAQAQNEFVKGPFVFRYHEFRPSQGMTDQLHSFFQEFRNDQTYTRTKRVATKLEIQFAEAQGFICLQSVGKGVFATLR